MQTELKAAYFQRNTKSCQDVIFDVSLGTWQISTNAESIWFDESHVMVLVGSFCPAWATRRNRITMENEIVEKLILAGFILQLFLIMFFVLFICFRVASGLPGSITTSSSPAFPVMVSGSPSAVGGTTPTSPMGIPASPSPMYWKPDQRKGNYSKWQSGT